LDLVDHQVEGNRPMSARGYDPECDKLSRYFLGELGAANHPRLVSELAQVIQDAIEDWIRSERDRLSSEIKRADQ
jgi:hypothetical protein